MTDRILLGFEVGTGKSVYLPLHHLAIFGMTQLSGKTRTLEAIISRSGLRAVAFIVKRGESGFLNYHEIEPYYKPRSDWQYIEGLLNVALKEKVQYQPFMRWAILKVTEKHPKTLREVLERSMECEKEYPRRKEVFEQLSAYLRIIVPELERHTFAATLQLSDGVNVMDLTGMQLEVQQIVIASTIEYVLTNLDHIVAIIPEAWQSLPQGKMTPIKWVAEAFVRQGASLGDYLWLDSQDIGGIDKTPLRQCDNWLMGRMKESHEVARILKQLLGAKVPAEAIQKLMLGHFYAAMGNEVKLVYVLPAGVPEEAGIDVALGKRTPESVRDEFLKVKVTEDDEMYREKCDELAKENDWLRHEFQEEKRKREECEKEFSRQLEVLSDRARQEGYAKANKEDLETITQLKEENAVLQDVLKKLEPLRAFREAFEKAFAIPTIRAEDGPTFVVPSMTVADVDARLNQRLSSGPTPIPVVSVDVDARLKELVKNEVVQRIVAKIKDLPDPAKKAAYWLHENKVTNVRALYNYVFDRPIAETGRVPGTFYINVVNPLVDAWLIINDAGNIRWVLKDKLANALNNVITDDDLEKVPKYLVSLLL
jgi:hypothetical protein